MLVLVYRKCSTCQKALKWLEENHIDFEERPIKEENPTYEELKTWHQMSGLPLKKFIPDLYQIIRILGCDMAKKMNSISVVNGCCRSAISV